MLCKVHMAHAVPSASMYGRVHVSIYRLVQENRSDSQLPAAAGGLEASYHHLIIMYYPPQSYIVHRSISAALLCVSSSSSRLLAHAAALGSTLFALTVRAAPAWLVGAAKEPGAALCSAAVSAGTATFPEVPRWLIAFLCFIRKGGLEHGSTPCCHKNRATVPMHLCGRGDAASRASSPRGFDGAVARAASLRVFTLLSATACLGRPSRDGHTRVVRD